MKRLLITLTLTVFIFSVGVVLDAHAQPSEISDFGFLANALFIGEQTTLRLELDPGADAGEINPNDFVVVECTIVGPNGQTITLGTLANPIQITGDPHILDLTYTGLTAGTDTITCTVDEVDGDGGQELLNATNNGGPAIKEWYSVSVSPTSDENLVNTSHSLQVTVGGDVDDFDTLQAQVTGGPSVGNSDATDDLTDNTFNNGVTNFTWTNDGGTGEDVVTVTATVTSDDTTFFTGQTDQDTLDPSLTARKTWIAEVPGIGDAAFLGLALLLMTGMAYAIFRRQSAFNGSAA